VAEEALSYTSIGILAIFNAELVAKLLVFGFKYFTHSRWALRRVRALPAVAAAHLVGHRCPALPSSRWRL